MSHSSAPRRESIWIKDLTDDQLREGIAGLSPAKLDHMIGSHFPGTKLPEGTTVTEALDRVNANFEVVKIPLQPVVAEGQLLPRMQTRVGLYRKDTLVELGSAGPTYGIIQNGEAFAPADILIANGEMALQAVQVIDGGSRVRLSGLIGTSHIEQLGGGRDVLAHFGIFEANHDGVHSTLGRLYTIRVRCLNGMTSKDMAAAFSIRHTRLSLDRLKEAQSALINVSTAAIEEAECFGDLAQRAMGEASFVKFAGELLDEIRSPLDDESSVRQRNNRDRDIAELVEFFNHGQGNVGQSGYDAYNAITEWITPRRESLKTAAAFAKKFESQATGYHARTKSRALRLLTR
jgi:hypothetical protein